MPEGIFSGWVSLPPYFIRVEGEEQGPCGVCGHDPAAPQGHATNPSGMCHQETPYGQCKCLHWVPVAPAPVEA